MLMQNDIKADKSNQTQWNLNKALRIEWIAQTTASVCWIASVFAYGISSAGDWLQLVAGSSWLIANLSTLASNEDT